MVMEAAETNEGYLKLTYPKVQLFLAWHEKPDEFRQVFSWFKERLTELKADLPDDPEKAMGTILQEMLEGLLARQQTPAQRVRE